MEWLDREMDRGAGPLVDRLLAFSEYRACPRTADGTATPEHHKARMLVLTDRGYECVAVELAVRNGMPYAPYPHTREDV